MVITVSRESDLATKLGVKDPIPHPTSTVAIRQTWSAVRSFPVKESSTNNEPDETDPPPLIKPVCSTTNDSALRRHCDNLPVAACSLALSVSVPE